MKINGIDNRRIHSCFRLDSINKKLESGKQLIIKSGIDPSTPEAHLGHLVGILLLKEFQRLGHKIVFVIGDFTAQLGDGMIRKKLTLKETKRNSRNHIKLVKKILGSKNVEIIPQNTWFEKQSIEELINDLSTISAAKILGHNSFRKRLDSHYALKMHELIYPFFMAKDSVMLKADIEIGSIEQKFNFQLTREFMKKNNLPPQDFILNKRLPGIDGSEKMSKSQNNSIGISESIDSQIAKMMQMKQEIIPLFFDLLTNRSKTEKANVLKTKKPKDVRNQLILDILALLHTADEVQETLSSFTKRKESKLITIAFTHNLTVTDILMKNKLVSSKREVKRLLSQEAIKVNSKKIKNSNIQIERGDKLEIGKKLIVNVITK
ncbi:MAG: tyrosine--tRNA ligase [Candidatus Dojkabacteria bacterium]|nr:tyrosine--tRNA ligase [Candidatus Dojkabacteria bacterium]